MPDNPTPQELARKQAEWIVRFFGYHITSVCTIELLEEKLRAIIAPALSERDQQHKAELDLQTTNFIGMEDHYKAELREMETRGDLWKEKYQKLEAQLTIAKDNTQAVLGLKQFSDDISEKRIAELEAELASVRSKLEEAASQIEILSADRPPVLPRALLSEKLKIVEAERDQLREALTETKKRLEVLLIRGDLSCDAADEETTKGWLKRVRAALSTKENPT
jgi:hypothetical protein